MITQGTPRTFGVSELAVNNSSLSSGTALGGTFQTRLHDYFAKAAKSSKVHQWADSLFRGTRDHVKRRILHLGSQAPERGIPEVMVCRILIFTWPFGPWPYHEYKNLETPLFDTYPYHGNLNPIP